MVARIGYRPASRRTVRRSTRRGAGRISLSSIPGGKQLRSDAAAAYRRMYNAARRAGIRLSAVSGFRSNAAQRRLYALYKSGRGNLAARPGTSKHEKGLAVDVATGRSWKSRVVRWLQANGPKFGFRHTVRSEPWHLEFRR